jgi:phosphoribosylformylglycinamidine (FGAM) synthase-like enzyme
VIQGPGENAGVIDIGDGQACVFKMESHNHPSFIEPYQGAATGVGGIMRDVFTMGARPIACLNALRFGAPGHPKTRHLVVRRGRRHRRLWQLRSACRPSAARTFPRRYDGNILVNAMAVGLADADKIFYAAASGVGNADRLSRLQDRPRRHPRRDHGLGRVRRGFRREAPDRAGRRSLRRKAAARSLPRADGLRRVIAIQDMGAAGLTSSAVEMGAKGDLGVELDLDAVPSRETGMSAYEMMLSESQERMLMVLKPGRRPRPRRSSQMGAGFRGDRLHHRASAFVVKHKGDVMADLPIKELGDEAPLYDRPHGRRRQARA